MGRVLGFHLTSYDRRYLLIRNVVTSNFVGNADFECPLLGMEQNMTIQLIFKIAAVGILVSVLNQVLKHSGREEQAFLASLAGLILVLFWIIPYIADLFAMIQKLFEI